MYCDVLCVIVLMIKMKSSNMAELQFEAPLAAFENEEWSDYNEFQGAEKGKVVHDNNVKRTNNGSDRNESDVGGNFGETASGSLEDLVNSFDERISKCFNNNEEVEAMAPVQIRTQDEIMNDCQ